MPGRDAYLDGLLASPIYWLGLDRQLGKAAHSVLYSI